MRRIAVRARGRLVCAALCLAALGAAEAHSYLMRSEPPDKATVAEPPPEVRLRFSEAIEPDFVKASVRRDGAAVEPAPVAVVDKDGKTVHLPLASGGPGDYEIAWSIVARDGHRTEGRIGFRVKAR